MMLILLGMRNLLSLSLALQKKGEKREKREKEPKFENTA